MWLRELFLSTLHLHSKSCVFHRIYREQNKRSSRKKACCLSQFTSAVFDCFDCHAPAHFCPADSPQSYTRRALEIDANHPTPSPSAAYRSNLYPNPILTRR